MDCKLQSHRIRCGHLVYNIVLIINNVLLTTNVLRAGEMAQLVKVLAIELSNLSLSLRTYMAEGEC